MNRSRRLVAQPGKELVENLPARLRVSHAVPDLLVLTVAIQLTPGFHGHATRSELPAIPNDVICIDDDPWLRQYWAEIMDHPPLEQLVVQGDEIFHQELPGSSEKKKYLGTPPISVVAKGDCRSIDREAIYSFSLNHAPCPAWRELFKKNGPVFPIQFDGDVLSIRCIPSNLESRYAEVKQAIQKTNSEFAKARQDLIAEIKAHQFQAAREEQKKLDAAKQVKKALDDLQL